jgi:AcrR family transcriptional regulator
MTAGVTEFGLRVDAQRNHGQLLEAAADAFAELGIDAPAEEIARRAGLAKGTLFRHFPAKGDLLAAVLADRLGQLRRIVTEVACEREAGLAALAEVMSRCAALLAADRSFFDAAMRSASPGFGVAEEKLALAAELDELLLRAQASGEVRSDVVGADLAMLIMAATNTCAPAHDHRPELWRRYLALMIDSLRPGDTTPLLVAALTPPETAQAMRAAVAKDLS